MTGEGAAAILTSLATLVGVVINGVLQLRQSKVNTAKIDATADKIDEVHAQATTTAAKVDVASAKIDTNTALTQVTANKVEEVRVAAIESTGSHQIMM